MKTNLQKERRLLNLSNKVSSSIKNITSKKKVKKIVLRKMHYHIIDESHMSRHIDWQLHHSKRIWIGLKNQQSNINCHWSIRIFYNTKPEVMLHLRNNPNWEKLQTFNTASVSDRPSAFSHHWITQLQQYNSNKTKLQKYIYITTD